MTALPALKYVTAEEYLAMEDASETKHELIGGEVYAMAGAGFSHNQISSNLFIDIGSLLRGKSCSIYGNDLKVHVKTACGFVYPDLTVICNGPQFLEGRKDVVTNPTIIIEVLSTETADYDHGKKFMLYRQLPALKEYVLVSSMEVLLEKFVREVSGAWTLTEFRSLEDRVVMESIGYAASLAEVYRDVVFDEKYG